MVTLYVTSNEPYAGKTLTCLALGTRWRRQGRKVGFLKPLGLLPVVVEGQVTDEDALFIARQLGVEAPPSHLCPIVLGPDICHADQEVMRQTVAAAFRAGAEGQEVMLVSGLGSLFTRGSACGLNGPAVAELLDARVLLVARSDSFLAVDSVLAARQVFGDRLAGVILNRVPACQREVIESQVVPCLKEKGIPLLGVLPDDPLLSSVSVAEIVSATGAELLCGEESRDELVENLVVGAMGVESALHYFRQTPRKCVITGGDRTDIHFAAIETSTRCLVLTGGLRPSHRVLARAEEAKVAVVLVKQDTLSTITIIEQLIGKQRVREPKKIEHALSQYESCLDLARLDAALGLA